MQPRILLVSTYHPEYLTQCYAHHAGWAGLDFEAQVTHLLGSGFALGDAYPVFLRAAGWDAREVIVNADVAQSQWAVEHGLALSGNVHDQRRQVLSAQLEHYRPEVLYVFEWSPLGDAFLVEMKSHVRLVVGQISSPLRPDRTYAAYDLMISSWPPIVEYFRHEGRAAEHLKSAFDDRVLAKLSPAEPLHDVTFVGGFAPSHPDRIPWLERLLEQVKVDIFGYGLERVPEGSPIRRHHRGAVWGLGMYEVLQRSRLTLNLHARIDVRGRVDTTVAAAMRLFEATGVGTCLLTDAKANLHEMFEPGREVLTFRSDGECIDLIRHYLVHPEQRGAVAAAGQARTRRDHTYAVRMRELSDILTRSL
ncbi:MAG TPA: glycosyltransferase [Phycisphaerae bacterium]|nr:glycosyltransferase [Phycisphaerae bacterium]HNU47138.1 glycosyltransferase [Phycisphaerae bacterium]